MTNDSSSVQAGELASTNSGTSNRILLLDFDTLSLHGYDTFKLHHTCIHKCITCIHVCLNVLHVYVNCMHFNRLLVSEYFLLFTYLNSMYLTNVWGHVQVLDDIKIGLFS